MQSLESQGAFCMAAKPVERKTNLVLQMLSVLLIHLWWSTTRCCCCHVDHTDILDTPVQHFLSETAAQINIWLCPRLFLQFGRSGVCHTGCMRVTSHFACSKQNNFLVEPFLCKAGPRSCGTARWIISFSTSPCV